MNYDYEIWHYNLQSLPSSYHDIQIEVWESGPYGKLIDTSYVVGFFN
jgi:hypothetical protein